MPGAAPPRAARPSPRRALTRAARAVWTSTGNARRVAGRLVAPAALAAVLASATVAVVLSGAAEQPAPASARSSVWAAASAATSDTGTQAASSLVMLRRESASRAATRPSRSARRVTLEVEVTGHQWSTDHLNVWPAPGERGERQGVIDPGKKLAVTGRTVGRWAEVVLQDEQARWVNAEYLSDERPEPAELAAAGAATGGLSSAPCPDGSSVESGITSTAVGLYRAACAAFPALATYGGYDPHGEHIDGRAIDFMTSDPALGTALAAWGRANASALGVRNVIWSQKIWSPERGAEGWRYMSDRGSATANHYDHVHIAVY